jgi:hypothetical protein
VVKGSHHCLEEAEKSGCRSINLRPLLKPLVKFLIMRSCFLSVLTVLSSVMGQSLLECLQAHPGIDCKPAMDLFILLDSSDSVGHTAFEQANDAIIDLVFRFDTVPTNVEL